jgi:bifunctional non-homologous end joining protein LigD
VGSVKVGGRVIETSSEGRVLFPKDGITKGDVIDYYRRISRWMVPHLRQRRLTIQRWHPDIYAEGTYQKDIPEHFPDWVDRIEVPKRGGTVNHVVCNSAATLVYLANQGCLTPHVGLARIDRYEHPDQMIFDLDPSAEDFETVRSLAFDLRALIEELGLVPFLKTTGSRGLHIIVPLNRRAHFDEVREFARQVAEVLVSRRSREATTEFYKEKRGGRVFVDTNRNGTAQTAVPAFAVRARDGAPVAMPIAWEELADPQVTPRSFHIHNAVEKMKSRADPTGGMAERARSLRAPANRLAKLI